MSAVTLIEAVVESYTVARHTTPPTTVVTVSWMENKRDHSWCQITLPNGDHLKHLRKGAKISIVVDTEQLTTQTPFDTANTRYDDY